MQIPDQNNAQYEEQYRTLIPLLRDYNVSCSSSFSSCFTHAAQMTVVKMLSDTEAHTVIVHATGSAETVAGPYRGEYVFFLKMDEAGDELGGGGASRQRVHCGVVSEGLGVFEGDGH